jgi:hypothetical protein
VGGGKFLILEGGTPTLKTELLNQLSQLNITIRLRTSPSLCTVKQILGVQASESAVTAYQYPNKVRNSSIQEEKNADSEDQAA